MRLEARQFSDGRGDNVSGVVAFPDQHVAGRVAAVVLAHGAGNDMNSPLLVSVQHGLARAGWVVVRFNFPYKERGGRAPDPTAVLESCYRSVVAGVRADPELRPPKLVIGGKSMGGRMATHLAAAGAAVDGVLLLGYPLHPAGKPQQLRVEHLPRIRVPMLFLAGTRDPLCDLDLLRQHLQVCPAPITIHVIEGGDHSFRVPKRTGRSDEQIEREIVDTAAAWLRATFAQ
jgi:uncharacterized protein